MKDKKIIILTKQLISFSFVGGIITVLSLIIYWGCVNSGIHYQIANAIGFVITVALAYFLNCKYTFNNSAKAEWSVRALIKTYVSYSFTGLFMASILLWLWTQVFNVSENIAPLLNLFFTVPFNFLLNKYWVYKRENDEKAL